MTLKSLLACALAIASAAAFTSMIQHPCSGKSILIYSGRWHEHSQSWFTCPGSEQPISLINGPIFALSPSGDRILGSGYALTTGDHPEHLVYEVEHFARPNPAALLPWEVGWLTPGWADDDTIAIPYQLTTKPQSIRLMRRNIATGVVTLLKTPITLTANPNDVYAFSQNYSAAITRVGDVLTYYDLQTREIIWQIEGDQETRFLPVLAPNGTKLIYQHAGTLSLIDSSGALTPLTQTAPTTSAASIAWSPDDQLILFWQINPVDSSTFELALLSLSTRDIHTYDLPPQPTSTQPILWLADAHTAALIIVTPDHSRTLILLDIQSGVFTSIDTDASQLLGTCICIPH
jgi:hypothetical protein